MKLLNWDYISRQWKYLRNHRAFKKAPFKTIFRTLYWVFCCQIGRSAIIHIPQWNCKFFLPPKLYRSGSTGIFVLREDIEPELNYLTQILSPGKVFIDAGANIGVYTVLAGKLVGETGRVLSFEPGQESFATLAKNVELNQLKQVKLLRTALSDCEGKTRLYHVNNAPNSYSLGSDSDGDRSFEEVSVTTLDRVVKREQIEQVDLIKMDVEGAEKLVLQGSEQLLHRMKPVVIFEVCPPAAQRLGLAPHDAWDLLQELGYQFFSIQSDGEMVPALQPRWGNFIAIPAQTQNDFSAL